MARRIVITDGTNSKAPTNPQLSSYEPQITFRVVARKFEEQRIQIRAPSREFVDSRWRDEAERLLLVKPNDNAEFTRLLFYLDNRFHQACNTAENLGRCEGPVTQSGLERAASSMERLLAFRKNAGDEPEKIAKIEARLRDLQKMNVNEVYAEFTKLTTREYDMSSLTPAQAKVAKVLIDNGGSIATTVIKEQKLDQRAVNALLKSGVCETPREGVLRLVEGKITKGPPPEEKLELSKPAKATKEPKAKTPKPEKPAVNPLELCLCGCGGKVAKTSRFLPGHDAKLHSLVLKLAKAKSKATDDKSMREAVKAVLDETAARLNSGPVAEPQKVYLKGAPWMTPELAKTFSL